MLLSPCQAQLFATVDAVTGDATLTDAGGMNLAVTRGQKIMRGQTVTTQVDAEVHAVTEDGGMIALRPNSQFQATEYSIAADAPAQVAMSLVKGALRSITGWIGKRHPDNYRLATATATIGIRGTDHETAVVELATDHDQPGTYDMVYEGATVMRTARGEIAVEAGQFGFVHRDGTSPPRLLDRPPAFLSKRRLRLEDRIETQKKILLRRVQQLLDDDGDDNDIAPEKLDKLSDRQREALKKKLRRLMQRKAN